MEDPLYFATPDDFRAWLAAHHGTEAMLWVGFHKRATGRPSITWPESVDQALCFGWIDGIRKSVDDTAYKIRFTPRKRRSTWSAVNIDRMKELIGLGLVHPAGLAAFEARPNESAPYSHERTDELPAEYAAEFQADVAAWERFGRMAPSYRRAAVTWVVTAKQEATRRRRLAQLIAASAAGLTVPPLTPPSKRSPENSR